VSHAAVIQERDAARALRAVAFTVFLDLLGFGIILPLLPYFAEELGASPAVVALLATAFSLAQLAMAPVLGRLSDRFGRRPVLLISVAGSAASAALLGYAGSVVLVFTSRIIAGMSKANLSTAHAYAADLVAPEQRARVMGRLGAAASLGLVAGPALGALLAVERMPTLPFLVTAGLSVVNFAMVWAWVPEVPGRRGAPSARAREASAASAASVRSFRLSSAIFWLLVVSLLFFIGYTSVQSTFALFTKRTFGWGSRETGGVLMLMGASMALAQGLAVPRIVAQLGEMGAATVGLLVFLGGAATIGGSAAAGSRVALLVGCVLLVTGAGVLQTTLAALVSLLARADERGLVLGLRESSGAFGRIFGPILGGLAFEAAGAAWPYAIAGAAALCGLAIVLVLGRSRRAQNAQPSSGEQDPAAG